MAFCGIRGQLNEWIHSFLSDRTQAVVLNGSRSDEINVTFGVPQGSVLGPILFTIFINDLPKEIKSQVRLFADDCIVYQSIKNQEDASILQEDINRLQKWADEWLMSFHPEKCELLRVTNKRRPLDVSYTMQDHNLKQVDTKKYLGVTLQKKLLWNNHVQNIYTKANNALSLIRRNMGSCP